MGSSVYELIERHVDALLTAVWYDNSKWYVIRTVNDLNYMIIHDGNRRCTEVASYIFKVLVLLYGDYGVAPAVGWIHDENKDYLLTAIDKWCNDMHIFESEGLEDGNE